MSNNQVVYLKIPVERDGFVDPSKINWSASKEQRLWNIISKSKRTEVNWNALSEQLSAPVTFLQQQAFWLYEQELEQLKNRIQLGTLSSETIEGFTPSPPPDLPLLKEKNLFKPRAIDLDNIRQTPTPFKELRFAPEQPLSPKQQDNTDNKLKTLPLTPNNTYNQDLESGSQSESDDNSSTNDINQGSMLLQRSTIMSKVAPKFNDLEEDETEDYGTDPGKYEAPDLSGSSLSNYSSVSITNSALEEALLNDSSF